MKYDGFPSFQEYPADFLGNRDWRTLSLAQKGLLQIMRFECWTVGNVPADIDDLAFCVGITAEELVPLMTPRVMKHFTKHDGHYTCESLDKYKAYLIERREKMAEGGRKGGKKTQAKAASSHHLSHPSMVPKASTVSNAMLSNGTLSKAKQSDPWEDLVNSDFDGVPEDLPR